MGVSLVKILGCNLGSNLDWSLGCNLDSILALNFGCNFETGLALWKTEDFGLRIGLANKEVVAIVALEDIKGV